MYEEKATPVHHGQKLSQSYRNSKLQAGLTCSKLGVLKGCLYFSAHYNKELTWTRTERKIDESIISGEGQVASINSFPFLSFPIAHNIVSTAWAYLFESFLFGILSTKLIQLWMSTILGDDVNHIIFIFSVFYLIFNICKWESPCFTLNYIDSSM